MNSVDPKSTDPYGAPKFLLMQKVTVSTFLVISPTEMLSFMDALNIRAPSMWTGKLTDLAKVHNCNKVFNVFDVILPCAKKKNY